jgi:hypothetical protein
MLYDLACNKNTTAAQVIEYNRYDLIFNRPLNDILKQQLHTLYTDLSTITINESQDNYIWR